MMKIIDNRKNPNDAATLGINVVATIRDAKTGRVLRVLKWHNKIPTVGLAAIANNLTSSSPSPANILIAYVEVGTGTNAPAAGDVALQTANTRSAVASRTNANGVAYVTGFFTATEAVATLREAGLFIGGSITLGTGTLFSRVSINITKSNTETLTLDWTITLTSVN